MHSFVVGKNGKCGCTTSLIFYVLRPVTYTVTSWMGYVGSGFAVNAHVRTIDQLESALSVNSGRVVCSVGVVLRLQCVCR